MIKYRTASIVELTQNLTLASNRELAIVVGYDKEYYSELRVSLGHENTNWFCFIGYNYDLYQRIKTHRMQENARTKNTYCVSPEYVNMMVKPYIFQFGEEIVDDKGLTYVIDKIEYSGSEGILSNKGHKKYLGDRGLGYIFYLKITGAQGMGRHKKVSIEELEKNYRLI